MQRKFLSNLALVLLLNLVIKPFWILGIDRTVQNVVGSVNYGSYYALLNFSFLFSIVLDLGITNFNNRNIAQHNQLLDKHVPSIISLKMALGTIYLVITLLFGFIIGYSMHQIFLLSLLGVNQFLSSFILYLRSNLSGLHQFRADGILSILDRAILIGLCSFLLWGNVTEGTFQIDWFVYAQTVSFLVTAFVSLILTNKNTQTLALNWNYAFSLSILKQSFPYALLILLMGIYTRIDAVMLERMLPDGAKFAGIYAQGFRLLDAGNMVAYLFAGLLLPMFSKMIKQNEPLHRLLLLSCQLLLTFAIGVSFISFLFSEEWVTLLYGEYVDEAHPVFAILMLCLIPTSTTYIFGTLLTARGDLKTLNKIALGGMLSNIILNLILIPKFQAYGAAMASLITQTATAIAQVILVFSVFDLNLNMRYMRSLFVFLTLLAVCGYAVYPLDLNWAFKVTILSLFIVLTAVGTRTINIPSIYKQFMRG